MQISKEEKKQNGVDMTPDIISNYMIELYQCDDFNNKKIMENSFGEGSFLLKIIDKKIAFMKKDGLTKNAIIENLKNTVYGIELNINMYNATLKKVYEKFEDNFGIKANEIDLSKNLINANTIEVYENYNGMFDLVIGNPPYARIHNMDKNITMGKEFKFVEKGLSDLYLIFYEMSLSMLNDTGELIYITPDSWTTSKTGSVMRKYVFDNNLVNAVCTLGHYNPFENATTYTGIYHLKKRNPNNQDVTIYKLKDDNEFIIKDSVEIPITHLNINDVFYFNDVSKYIDIINTDTSVHFKNGIATLCDSFFIRENKQYDSMVNITKISTGKKLFCIYPYDEKGDMLDIDAIKNIDIHLYQDFINNKEDNLLRRSIKNNEEWTAFGRSQGLKDVNKNRIAINNLYKTIDNIKINYIPAGELCYSGIYVIEDIEQGITLENVQNIFLKQDFIDYATIVGNYKSGGYKCVNKKYIEKYISYHLEDKC